MCLGLLEKKTSRTLEVSQEELEDNTHAQYSEPAKKEPLGSPGYMPKPAESSSLFETSPRKLSKIRQVIYYVRTASAAGPNRIFYKLYKKCLRVLKQLCTLMRVAKGSDNHYQRARLQKPSANLGAQCY